MFALRRSVAFAILSSFISLIFSGATLAEYAVVFDDDISIYSKLERNDNCPKGDGLTIDANVFIPQGSPGETFPAIIFVPGWGVDKYEYILQAEKFAKKGYITFSYSPRGMGDSEGVIEAVSPNDIADYCAVIDWVMENTPVDPERIGSYGMSYGGGVSLVGLAHDPRIKVVGTASTWGDIKDSFYEGDTPNFIWINNLLVTGELRASVSTELFRIKDDLLAGENLESIFEWARFRSPLTYVDIYNQRQTYDPVQGKTVSGVPIYISKNNGDYLFKTNRLLELYERLNGPKKMDTNLGIHSMQEQEGMKLKPNVTWDNLHLWFDYWLKGIDNGVMEEPNMSMRIKNTRKRDYFMEWPSPDMETQTLYLNKDFLGGFLNAAPMDDSDLFVFDGAIESGARIGVPILTPWLEGVGIFNRLNPETVDDTLSAEFVGDPLAAPLYIRGTTEMSLWVTSEKSDALVVAYLYDLAPNGKATLITHGPATAHDGIPGEPMKLEFELTTVAYDVAEGHQLLLFIDSFDWLYYSPYEDPYRVELLVGNGYDSMIKVPVRVREEEPDSDDVDNADDDSDTSDRGANGEGGEPDGKTISGGSFSLFGLVLLAVFWSRRRLSKTFRYETVRF